MFDLIYTGDLSVVEFRAIAAQVLGDANTPSRARINAAVNHTEPFGGKDNGIVESLKSVMADLVQLKHEHKIPINFSKVEKIAEIIRARRESKEKEIARWWYVFPTLEGYLVRVENGKVISTNNINEAASTQKIEVATEVEKRLVALGYRAGRKLIDGQRMVREMLMDVSQYGFEQ